MPVFLKDIKRELESDIGKVGQAADGSYKFEPPNIVGRKISKYTKLKVTKVSSTPTFGTNSISYNGLAASESDKGIKYKVTIRFHDMQFKDIASKQFSTEAKMGKVTKYHRIPTVQRNPVMLKCSCQDFRHRFETQLSNASGLVGGPRKYTRKTPPWPIGYPFANSTNKLGICKHVNSLLFILKDKGLIKER